MADTVLLTGATGYIGASLLRKWLESSEATLVLLVRGKRDDSPRTRIERVLAETYSPAEAARLSKRIEIAEGDLSSDRFGLDATRYRDLASMVSHIIHCAAAARFDLDLEDARRTNVGGTRLILDFGRSCPALRRSPRDPSACCARCRWRSRS